MGSAAGPPVPMARISMGVAAPSSRRSARPGEAIAARSSPPRCFDAWDVATAFAPWLLAQRLARDGDVLLSDVNFAFDPLQRKPALLAPGEGAPCCCSMRPTSFIPESGACTAKPLLLGPTAVPLQRLPRALAEAPESPWRPPRAPSGRPESWGSGSSGGALSALLDQALHSLRELPFSSPLRPLRGELLRFHRLQQLERHTPTPFAGRGPGSAHPAPCLRRRC